MDLSKAPEVRIANLVAGFPTVDQVILFGSRARGDAKPRSDIDLAVACPKASAKDWLTILGRIPIILVRSRWR